VSFLKEKGTEKMRLVAAALLWGVLAAVAPACTGLYFHIKEGEVRAALLLQPALQRACGVQTRDTFHFTTLLG
jgi:hypothetical protein